ncbi:MAG: ABC transporter permease [Planctomycetota bacterium]
MSAGSVLRQTWALTRAEWLRQLTGPIWAVLLVLWTLVCALFFSRVIQHASAVALPAGETPVTWFFRASPEMLSLLLVVFIPQLTMEAVAGRRERGRLEHLEAAGTRRGALLLAAFTATCSMLLLLLIPPLVIHVVLASKGDADFGRTLGGILAIYLEACAVAALGLCASCWAPRRVSASLIALACGIVWWILSVYGYYADHLAGGRSDPAAEPAWWTALSLQYPIREFASGLVDWRTLGTYLVLIAGLLALGRIGLHWHVRRLARAAGLVATVVLITGLLRLQQEADSTWDLTWRSLHSISPATVEALDTLDTTRAPLHATLLESPAMGGDPVDGALLAATRSFLRATRSHAVRTRSLDPGLEPQAARALCRELHLSAADLEHPVVILRHAERTEVLRARDLGVIGRNSQGERELTAIHVESAFLNAIHRLQSGRTTTVAWLRGPTFRALEARTTIERDEAVGAWRRHFATLGLNIAPLELERLGAGRFDLVVLPGPRADLPAPAIAALRAHLERGGAVLLALDGQRSQRLPLLRDLLAAYGLDWSQGLVLTAQGWHDERPDLQPVVQVLPQNESGPAGLCAREARPLHLPYAVPVLPGEARDSRQQVDGALRTPRSAHLMHGRNPPRRLPRPQLLLGTSAPIPGAEGPRIAVLGSVDALADSSLGVAGNRLLATGLARWLARPQDALLLPPRAIEARRYHLSPGERGWLLWGLSIILPLAATALGLSTWWWRRHR